MSSLHKPEPSHQWLLVAIRAALSPHYMMNAMNSFVPVGCCPIHVDCAAHFLNQLSIVLRLLSLSSQSSFRLNSALIIDSEDKDESDERSLDSVRSMRKDFFVRKTMLLCQLWHCNKEQCHYSLDVTYPVPLIPLYQILYLSAMFHTAMGDFSPQFSFSNSNSIPFLHILDPGEKKVLATYMSPPHK